MEDFIQKQDDALFQEIDNHLIELYYGRCMEYPPFDKVLIALDRAHKYPTERNVTRFNKLHRLLSNLYSLNFGNNKSLKLNESTNTSIIDNYFMIDILPGYGQFEVFEKIRESVLSINYCMYDSITLEQYLGIFNNSSKDLMPKNQINTDTESLKFDPKIVKEFIELLEIYFSPEHFIALKNLLVYGTKPDKKLCFKGPANRLADCFKRLIEANLIIGCNHKTDLERWISENFENFHRGKVKPLILSTLRQTISEQYRVCKNPILEVKRSKETGAVQLIKQ